MQLVITGLFRPTSPSKENYSKYFHILKGSGFEDRSLDVKKLNSELEKRIWHKKAAYRNKFLPSGSVKPVAGQIMNGVDGIKAHPTAVKV